MEHRLRRYLLLLLHGVHDTSCVRLPPNGDDEKSFVPCAMVRCKENRRHRVCGVVHAKGGRETSKRRFNFSPKRNLWICQRMCVVAFYNDPSSVSKSLGQHTVFENNSKIQFVS